jgi:hypothetical protein
VTFYQSQPGRRRRAPAYAVLRSRLMHWCLFFVPTAATPIAWNNGYPEAAGLTAFAGGIGLVWFVRVWRETER